MSINSNAPIDTVPYLTTVIPANRLAFLNQTCRRVLNKIPGHILEVGVYKGGTLLALAKAIKEICPKYKVYGIDTFSGHPYSDGHEVHPAGKYGDVDKRVLQQKLADEGVAPWVVLVEGKVEEVLIDLHLPALSFVHIDCDLYVPVRYCAEHVPPLMREKGIIYFDDYGHDHCPGATKAVEEVFSRERITNVSLPDGTCWSGFVTITAGCRSAHPQKEGSVRIGSLDA